jgi:hypothetical protein
MENEELKKKYPIKTQYKIAIDAILNDGKIKSTAGLAEKL